MDEKNSKYTHTPEEISNRMKLIAGVFQKDAQILTLEREKMEQMQRLYDLEMKMYGRMSKLGNEIFEVQHCEVFHGKVREMAESEWKESREEKTNGQQANKGDKGKSVHEKLDSYKKQTDVQSHSEGMQKKDVPER